jgi:transcriptional regulator with XRE-family HTH domain
VSRRTSSPTARFLAYAIDYSRKTQREIAEEVGLSANSISMMKNGICKVPINRIPALAEACGVDPVTFLKIAMEEYEPEAWTVLHEVFGGLLAEDELRWLRILRSLRKRKTIIVNADLCLAVYLFAERFQRKRLSRPLPEDE